MVDEKYPAADKLSPFQQRTIAGLRHLADRYGNGQITIRYEDTGKGYYAASVRLRDTIYDFEV